MAKTPDPILPPDELGEKGENRFGELCADAGLVANRSHRDRTGWDFIVQDKASLTAGDERLDARAGVMTCFVQLKTMAATTDRIETKLSAVEYLAKEITPAFICALEVDADLDVIALYLVHVRGDFLERILKRLREAERDKLQLNETMITFAPRSIGQRLAPKGKMLREALSAASGRDPSAYARTKVRELRTLGVENGRYAIKTTLHASPNDIAEAFLDQRPLKARILEHSETRFGITLPTVAPLFAGDVEMRFDTRPTDTCKVRVAGPMGTTPTRLDGELFLLPPQLGGGQRTRIRTAYFTIDVNDAQIKFQTIDQVTIDASYNFFEWRKYYRFFSSLRGPDISVEVAPRNSKLKPIRMTIRTALDEERLETAEAAIELCNRGIEVFEAAGLDTPHTTYLELLERAQAVFETHSILKQDAAAAPSITLPAGAGAPPPNLTMFYTNYLRFPQTCLAQAAEVFMEVDATGDEIVVRPVKVGRVLTNEIDDSEHAYSQFIETAKSGFVFDMTAIAAWNDDAPEPQSP